MNTDVRDELIRILEGRFARNMQRHSRLDWNSVLAKLLSSGDKLAALHAMESSGGEPDVVAVDGNGSAIVYIDCAPESPVARRSLCYDRAALDARKENKPGGSAVESAAAMGIELLSEAQYRELQTLGTFDRKTSSWVKTPPAIRQLGGALFCDRRYDQIFVYHNGAESYYAARGFRGRLML